MRHYTVCKIENADDLWDIRQHTPVGSLFYADYKYAEQYGLDREAALNLFDFYYDEFAYEYEVKLKEARERSDNWSEYEVKENRLWTEWDNKMNLWECFEELCWAENESEPEIVVEEVLPASAGDEYPY